MVESLFSEIETQVIAGLIIIAIVGLGTFITSLWICVHKQGGDVKLIKKFLAIQSRMIDDSTKKNHPKDSLELRKLADEVFQEK